jgi:hypothetical protein
MTYKVLVIQGQILHPVSYEKRRSCSAESSRVRSYEVIDPDTNVCRILMIFAIHTSEASHPIFLGTRVRKVSLQYIRNFHNGVTRTTAPSATLATACHRRLSGVARSVAYYYIVLAQQNVTMSRQRGELT